MTSTMHRDRVGKPRGDLVDVDITDGTAVGVAAEPRPSSLARTRPTTWTSPWGGSARTGSRMRTVLVDEATIDQQGRAGRGDQRHQHVHAGPAVQWAQPDHQLTVGVVDPVAATGVHSWFADSG